MSDTYAVIGNPIGHSKSPLIHTAFAQQTGQDMTYTALEAPVGGFCPTAEGFRAAGGRGLNITAPFKLDAFAYATDLTEAARRAGAVNAIKFEDDRIVADNFDGVGLVNDIQRNLGYAIRRSRVLIVGAGGAARGAIGPVLEQEPVEVIIVNRTLATAEALRDGASTGRPVVVVDPSALVANGFGPFDIVINATSASQRGELPAVTATVFGPATLAYEMVYGKGLTPFLRLAQDAGAGHLADGVGMLVEQAAEAFLWWRGVRPETRPLIEVLTVPLV